ncbi:MAG: HEPN domain-containing protein [archaeon]|nr:HEPN domain-containing protein [archaeon]
MKPGKWQIWLEDRRELEKDFGRYMRTGQVRRIGKQERLSNIHIEKAFHNLDFANFTLSDQNRVNKRIVNETYFDWVIIISYYAMYHAALSMLYEMGFKSSSHLGTICVLCKECMGKNLNEDDITKISQAMDVNEEEIKGLGRAKERREKASYSGSITFEKHLAEMTITDARKFINKIADILSV